MDGGCSGRNIRAFRPRGVYVRSVDEIAGNAGGDVANSTNNRNVVTHGTARDCYYRARLSRPLRYSAADGLSGRGINAEYGSRGRDARACAGEINSFERFHLRVSPRFCERYRTGTGA